MQRPITLWAQRLAMMQKQKNDYATAVGYSSTGSGNQSSAFGFNAEATAMNTTAVGSYANASGAIFYSIRL